MTDPVTRLNAALEGRVALKVLKAELAAVVGAERFLAEIAPVLGPTSPCRPSGPGSRTTTHR